MFRLFCLFLMSSTTALAALHPKSAQDATLSGISPELIAAYEASRAGQLSQRRFDLNTLIPGNIAALPHQQILPSMVDAGITNWINSPTVRDSFAGRAVTTVEQTMNQDVTWNTAGADAEEKIEHRLSLQVLAAQAAARIRYEGLLQAQAYHYVVQQITGFELNQAIDNKHSVVVTQVISPTDRVSNLSVRVSF